MLSQEQQRLCGYRLDGKPRLVRGVAGSGKTLVLANWLARTVGAEDYQGKAWIIYANQALHGLLERTIEASLRDVEPDQELPRERFELMHVHALLEALQ